MNLPNDDAFKQGKEGRTFREETRKNRRQESRVAATPHHDEMTGHESSLHRSGGRSCRDRENPRAPAEREIAK